LLQVLHKATTLHFEFSDGLGVAAAVAVPMLVRS
jgi:hypothetical protein